MTARAIAGPELKIERIIKSSITMADISCPVSGANSHEGSDLHKSPLSADFALEPNPDFVFPMHPDSAPFSFGQGSPEIRQKSTASSGIARHRPERINIDPAPDFLFPAPSTPPATGSSQSSNPSPSRRSSRPGGGHRRGGSEYIGGNGNGSTLGQALISSSPTKGVNTLPPPPRPSHRPHGHAHRRSTAASQHDLSAIIKPHGTSSRRTGSAPSTPSDPDALREFIPSLEKARSQPALPSINPHEEATTESSESATQPPARPRPRVNFSDKLEFIPRPLSIISSATSSSISTVRAGHSLTGSISSLRSNNTPSPPAMERDEEGDIFGNELHPSAFAHSSTAADGLTDHRITIRPPKRYSSPPPESVISDEEVFTFPAQEEVSESFIAPESEVNAGFSESTSAESKKASSTFSDSVAKSTGTPISRKTLGRPKSSPEIKQSKREKKGKSWSGLLSRKHKSSEFANRANDATPFSHLASSASSPERQPTSTDFSIEDINFDEDSTFVLRSPEFDVPRSAPTNPNPSWHSDSDSEPEAGPVLDLDAAWDDAGKEIQSREKGSSGFGAGKRRLHSGAITSGFQGPGMNYHRRAESAPVMAPVDYQLGFPRFGSNPQMADVFEEDEDEEIRGIQVQDEVAGSESFAKHFGSSSSERGHTVDTTNEESLSLPRKPLQTGWNETGQLEEIAPPSNVDIGEASGTSPDLGIVEAADEPRFSVITKSSDESTITPTLSNDPLRSRPVPPSLEFVPPRVDQFSGSGYSSLNPSPSPAKTSFEGPRLGTAHSSTTERSGWSSTRTGDGSAEVTYSMEDVPSLTSSASTMVSHAVPITPIAGTRPDAERSQSVSEAAAQRPGTATSTNTKRRSLGGLSMLRLGSYGSKSKLSIETRPGSEASEAPERTKKRHRISQHFKKLFNKSKENLQD